MTEILLQDYDNEDDISLTRNKIYFEFVSPFLIICKEEISIYNDGNYKKFIYHKLAEHRDDLIIYDSDGQKLEYHSPIEAYFINRNADNSLEETTPEIDDSQDFFIIIDFPRKKLLEPKKIRRITLAYKKFFPAYQKNALTLKFVLNQSAHAYILIQKPDLYIWLVHSEIISTDNENHQESVFSPADLDENDYLYITDTESIQQNSKIDVKCYALIENCSIRFKIRFRLTQWQRWWYRSGFVVGIVGVITGGCFLFTNKKEMLSLVLQVSGISFAYLTIIKGWVFTKDLEKIEDFIEEIKLPFKSEKINIPYDAVYLVLIALLLAELILGVFTWGLSVEKDTFNFLNLNIINIYGW